MCKNRGFCNGVSEFSGIGVGVAVGSGAVCPYGLPPPRGEMGILLWGIGVDMGFQVLGGGDLGGWGGYGVIGEDMG